MTKTTTLYSHSRTLSMLGMALAVSIVMTEPAFAQALGNVEGVLNNIVSFLTGSIARSIAIIARGIA